MVATDLDLFVHDAMHYAIRRFMREGGLSADEAFDAALTTLLDLAQEINAQGIDGAEELAVCCMLLPQLRDSILQDYRKPQPDLSDLEPLMTARKMGAVEFQRQRRRRRQLGSRP